MDDFYHAPPEAFTRPGSGAVAVVCVAAIVQMKNRDDEGTQLLHVKLPLPMLIRTL